MYIYIYIAIDRCIYTSHAHHMHTYPHTYIPTYLPNYIHACIQHTAYIHSCIHTYIRGDIEIPQPQKSYVIDLINVNCSE